MQDEFKQVAPDQQNFNLKQFLYEKVFNYWYIYVLCMAMALIVANYYLWYATPIYTSSTSVLLGIEEKKYGAQDLLASLGSIDNSGGIESQIQIIKSRNIISRTIQNLDFKYSYFLEGDIKTSELYKNCPFELITDSLSNNHFPALTIKVISHSQYEISYENPKNGSVESKIAQFNTPLVSDIGTIELRLREPKFLKIYKNSINEKNLYKVYFNSSESLVRSYSSRLNITQIKGTRMLLISVDDAVPQKGCDFLNKLTEVYLAYGVEQKNEDTENSLRFIDEQLDIITNELVKSENELEKYKTEKGLVNLNSISTITLEDASRIENELSQIEIKQSFLKYLEDYIRKGKEIKYLSPAYVEVTEPILQSLITSLSVLQADRENALKLTTADNPLIQNKNIQIENTKAEILEKIKSIRDAGLVTKLETYNHLQKIRSKLQELPKAEKDLSSIERQASITENLYTYLLQKRAETAIILASTISDSKVIDNARTALSPIKPERGITFTFAVLLGLFIPATIVYFREVLDDRIKSRKVLEKSSPIPVLGIIGFTATENNIVVNLKPHSQITEAFRSIRSNLQYFHGSKSNNIILITSSISAEGKSFCAINLAAILASGGKKVIMLGCDLRKPQQPANFKLSSATGLSNYLIGSATLDEVIQHSDELGMDLILSGPKPPNPSEILLNDKMNQLIGILKQQYDYVIIDSPPIGLISDGLELSRFADVTIYIVRQNFTRKHHLDFVNKIYLDGKIKNLCVIFNGVKIGTAAYGYGYGYGYAYGYGYGYGYGYYEEDNKDKNIFQKIKKLIKRKDAN
jgi:capsular exopolysaccharide synthesis family protein